MADGWKSGNLLWGAIVSCTLRSFVANRGPCPRNRAGEPFPGAWVTKSAIWGLSDRGIVAEPMADVVAAHLFASFRCLSSLVAVVMVILDFGPTLMGSAPK